MDFGKVPYIILDKIDFTLPRGDDSILPGKGDPNFKFYLGASKWGKREWCGSLYPKWTKEAKFFDEYLKRFNYLELNAIFYQLPKQEQIRSWVEKMKAFPEFKCTPKVSRQITHVKKLIRAEEETLKYIDAVHLFGKHLGPCFFQVSDKFGPNHYSSLEQYLMNLPTGFQANVEVRQPEWFEPENLEKITKLLIGAGIGMVITDTPGRRDVAHMHVTNECVHVRFNTVNNKNLDQYRLEMWRDRIIEWKTKGVREVYFALDSIYDEGQAEIPAVYTEAKRIFADLI